MLDYVRIKHGKVPWSDRTDWMIPSADRRTIDWPVGSRVSLDIRVAKFDADDALAVMNLSTYRTCIQAGGCVGFWPLQYSQYFERVITFEPEPVNYHCLLHNIEGTTIEAFQYALGSDSAARVHMDLEPHYTGHCGAWQVMPGGDIETLRIDDIGLDDVDLIYLDIEGSEYDALLGAAETIRRCRPVIGLENTGLNLRYHNGASPVELLETEHGYKVTAVIDGKDVILHAPAS